MVFALCFFNSLMLRKHVGCSPDVVECGDSSPPFASSGDEVAALHKLASSSDDCVTSLTHPTQYNLCLLRLIDLLHLMAAIAQLQSSFQVFDSSFEFVDFRLASVDRSCQRAQLLSHRS